MGIDPFNRSNLLDEDFQQRQIADIRRDIRELAPSVARSFGPVVTDLLAKQAALDDLLTRVVAPGILYTSATNFSLNTTLTTKASITVTVPAGYTTAQVSVTGRVFAINPNTTGGSNSAGGDYLIAQTYIGAYNGAGLPLTTVGLNSSSINSAPFSVALTGLVAGNTFNVFVKAGTSFLTWAASTSNTVELTGSVLWLR